MWSDLNPNHCWTWTLAKSRGRILLEWPSQISDLKSAKVLRNDLKRAVHTRHPKTVADLN